jgi:non-ribosomal peptide synthetase component F
MELSSSIDNSYGTTEACVDVCRNAYVTPTTDPSNIGYPIGTHLWVVEPGNYNQLAPVGCPGELLISGPTLARGYLNDEEKNPWSIHRWR